MKKYLVETSLPADALGECSSREWRARSATAELRRQGVRVRFDRVVRVPEDGLCLFVFEAASERDATRAAELARLDPFQVVEAARSGRRARVG